MTDIGEEAALKALDRLYQENESGLKRLAQMDQEHPMLPTQEQLTKWDEEYFDEGENFDVMMIKAFQAGADKELEACCADLRMVLGPNQADWLHSVRRPKPPSLKEQALLQLDTLNADLAMHGMGCDLSQIRRALESLPE